MSTLSDKERLAVIETTLKEVQTDMENLTLAVTNLTAVLEQSKGAKTVVGVVTSAMLFLATLWVAAKEFLSPPPH